MARKLAAGNWKMHGLAADLTEVARLAHLVTAVDCEVLLCLPATLIERGVRAAGGRIAIGGQDCHRAASGAHTGDISAAMLVDAGASHVILGHSERRAAYHEDDRLINDKLTLAQAAGLTTILCLGETLEQRRAGETLAVVRRQLTQGLPPDVRLERLVLAYEPVWAIGSGLTPTLPQIAEVHATLRATLADRHGARAGGVPLLYGGSVKPGNAAEIFALPEVDGALVGGASLKADEFGAIVAALAAA